jgi:transposase
VDAPYLRYVVRMAGQIFLAPHHSTEDLERRYKAANNGIERSHLEIIWLLSQGHAAKFVAEITGYSSTWVSKLLWRYNDHGLAGLGDQRHHNPGAAALLDKAQQDRLRAALAKPPPDHGQWTGRKEGTATRFPQWMASQLGRLVSPQRGVEDMRRLDLTPQLPRPCHVGADWLAQHTFKKSSGRAWSSSPAPKRRFRLRSGALMSIASG